MPKNKFAHLISKFNLFSGMIFFVGLLINNLFTLLLGLHIYKIDAYIIVIYTILAPLIIMSYIILLLIDRKKIAEWWRILLMILPFAYIIATIGDIQSQKLTLKGLLDPKTPVVYNTKK